MFSSFVYVWWGTTFTRISSSDKNPFNTNMFVRLGADCGIDGVDVEPIPLLAAAADVVKLLAAVEVFMAAVFSNRRSHKCVSK